MDHITNTLKRLASTFTTRDIMISEERLVWANSPKEAQQKLSDYPSFDLIPIKCDGNLTKYLARNELLPKPIEREDLVSDSTPILDLACLLSQRSFCFVLSTNRICGYVHYSDLNNQLVKIPFYVLLEAVESHIVTKIEGRITESDLDAVLSKDRSNYIKKQVHRLSEERADLGFINFMYFRDMVLFATYYQLVNLPEKDIKWLNDVRNRVDHADKPLITSQRDTIKLIRTREVCMSILDQLNSKS